MFAKKRLARLAAALAALALVTAACGNGDGDGDGAAGGSQETTNIEVTLYDYGFRGLPARVAVGTTVTVRNESAGELHELVAVRLPDDEERSVEALLALPEQELFALLGGEPEMVLLAAPGSNEQVVAVGTGTFTRAGRYLVACFIPTGADPDEYLNAAAESEGGPPEVDGGPPHFVHGMHAELIVE